MLLHHLALRPDLGVPAAARTSVQGGGPQRRVGSKSGLIRATQIR